MQFKVGMNSSSCNLPHNLSDALSQKSSHKEDQYRAELLAYHGWGYGSKDWQGWQDWLQGQHYLFKPFNRGYFGSPIQPQFSTSAIAKLIFTHSYGLHFCPAEILRQANLLVIFSSFRQFHPQRASLKKRSQQILQQMILQAERQPQTVLQNFRTKCLQPLDESDEHQQIPELLNTELLYQDLCLLDTCLLDLLPLQQIPQIIVLHGIQDRIVSVTTGKALAEELAASYFAIEAAGHALPFMQITTCQAILQPIFEAL